MLVRIAGAFLSRAALALPALALPVPPPMKCSYWLGEPPVAVLKLRAKWSGLMAAAAVHVQVTATPLRRGSHALQQAASQ